MIWKWFSKISKYIFTILRTHITNYVVTLQNYWAIWLHSPNIQWNSQMCQFDFIQYIINYVATLQNYWAIWLHLSNIQCFLRFLRCVLYFHRSWLDSLDNKLVVHNHEIANGFREVNDQLTSLDTYQTVWSPVLRHWFTTDLTKSRRLFINVYVPWQCKDNNSIESSQSRQSFVDCFITLVYLDCK